MELTARTRPNAPDQKIDLLGPGGQLVGQLAPVSPFRIWDATAADDVLDDFYYETIRSWEPGNGGTIESIVKLR